MSKRTTIIILALVAIASFLIRTLPHLSSVFQPFGITFIEPDAYYHLRLTEWCVANFPNYLHFDAYAVYGGANVGYRPLLDWLVAVPAWLIGLGHPSIRLIEIVMVWMPPILGTLVIIPTYFLAKALFSQRTAIIACILIAVMPSEFMNRSQLGFSDHHVLESLLAITVVLFLVLADKKNKWWLAVVAGLFLGLYLWNWSGSMFLVAIIFVWYLIGFFKGEQLPGHVFLCFITAFIVILPYLQYSPTKYEYLLPIMACLVLFLHIVERNIYSRVEDAAKLSVAKKRFQIFVAVGSVVAFITLWFLQRGLVDGILYQAKSIFWGFGSSINEARPMGLNLFIYQYGVLVIFAVCGLWLAIKKKVSVLFIVFSVVWIAAMFGQRRWGYYGAIPLAMLVGLAVDRVLANTGRRFVVAIAGLIAVLMGITLTPGNISIAQGGSDLTQSWYGASVWMRDNTPEPFTDPNAYYKEIHETPQYGVLSWWDQGHWLLSIAHRPCLSTNTYQYSLAVSSFLTGQSIEESEKAIEGYNVRYILLDERTVTGTFYAQYGMKMGTDGAGWERYITTSTEYRLYTQNKYGNYSLLKQFGDVKIFERAGE